MLDNGQYKINSSHAVERFLSADVSGICIAIQNLNSCGIRAIAPCDDETKIIHPNVRDTLVAAAENMFRTHASINIQKPSMEGNGESVREQRPCKSQLP